ncbi:3-oxoadipate enol-lactonase [Georgenia sp. EYE_87]|uniref:3-oxoadipate enol-lactonase n=1 Tax=Georgenia sp. EYE_87 TaxID=2853448 RepID=UPI0020047B4E|nr:3-oxoadipate enol-lactonase [Georgenia sp. EYE_87]MCK6209046.1 3-oxoadipate enol-lactonase [Georgenia sp. EYE_87]
MPTATTPGVTIRYEVDGDAANPTIVLSNSLGTNLDLWEPQVGALAERFHVVRYDSRGHGRSSAPAGPYTMSDLAGDVVALLDHLEVGRAHVVGISVGGLTGQYLAVEHPERVDRLVVANTAAKIGEPQAWLDRAALVESAGLGAIADTVVEKWLTPGYAEEHPELADRLKAMLLATDDAGYAATCHVLAETDLRGRIGAIAAPTLVIGASGDLPTPPAATRAIAEGVPGARYVEVDAAHISNLEATAEVTAAVLGFLS